MAELTDLQAGKTRVGIGNRLVPAEKPAAPNAERLIALCNERRRLEREAMVRPTAKAIAAVIEARRLELAASSSTASATSPGLVQPDYVPRNDRGSGWQLE